MTNESWTSFLALSVCLFAGGCGANVSSSDGAGGSGSTTTSTQATSSTGTGIPTNTDPDKHGFPDDVYAVLQARCTTCHGDPLKNGAPQSFEYYDDLQEEYYPNAAGTAGARWWSQIGPHTFTANDGTDTRKPPAAPLQQAPIPKAEQEVLKAWLATCGDDPSVPKLCALGSGTKTPP
jgi:hypothetical protein